MAVTDVILNPEIVKYEFNTDIMSLEWWQKNIIYHLYLPSFKDSNNDGVGDFQGDWQINFRCVVLSVVVHPYIKFNFDFSLGLTSNLSYFEYLSIKTLLISPFYPSPMKDNGYDISSYVDIDPLYGSMDDFNNFMTEVKNRGM